MDEPGQQQMALDSQMQLFKFLGKGRGQSIVASSLSREELLSLVPELSKNIVDLGDYYVIIPIN